MMGLHLWKRGGCALRCFAACYLILVLLGLNVEGCSGFVVFSGGRLLAVVSVSPTSADPLNFPNGVVPFVATGTFNSQPSPITPLPSVQWTVGAPLFGGGVPIATNATIDQNGNATCAAGFTGAVQVFANAPVDSNQPLSLNNQKVGTATLICP